MLYELLIQPFHDYAFMRRALVACIAMGLGCGPIGTFLVLRRMSLIGDAMAHALLPGAAVGFLVVGFSILGMSIGSFVAAMIVAALATLASRMTSQREDASFAAFYLIALALGVTLISTYGSSLDLMHVLFGTILAVDDASMFAIAAITSVTLVVLAAVYRPLVMECFDAQFLRTHGGKPGRYHLIFMFLVVANLVGAFQALGTLMAVGLLMLPAAAARFWTNSVAGLSVIAALIAAVSGFVGLLLSYHHNFPSGPAIVLAAGGFYLTSLLFGYRDSVIRNVCSRAAS